MAARLIAVLLAAAVVMPAAAQPNPFKVPANRVNATIAYQLGGDQAGTAQVAIDGDRLVSRSDATMKMMGRSDKSSTWSLMTSDSMYTADLDKGEGFVGPNLLPYYAKAYDALDGSGKRRFHDNVGEMSALMSKVFDIKSFGTVGQTRGEQTIAGEVCENREFGGFVICSMKKAPQVALHTKGSVICFEMEQTATSVSLAAPAPEAFAVPAGISFKRMPGTENPDSAARGFVGYLASEALADSIQAAKADLEKARAEAAAKGQPTELTQEQQAQMKQACEFIKNVDVGQVMANALNSFADELKQEAVNAAKDAANDAVKDAKGDAKRRVRGIIRRPRLL